jgi:hypothetical protein
LSRKLTEFIDDDGPEANYAQDIFVAAVQEDADVWVDLKQIVNTSPLLQDLVSYDLDETPVVGDVLLKGPNGVIGRAPFNVWDLYNPLPAVDFATPLAVDIGPVITRLCWEVETDGDLELADPTGTPATLVPGLCFEYLVKNGGTDDLIDVPASWRSGQAEIPQIAQGAGAYTTVLVKIEEVDITDDEVEITRAVYLVIPGPDEV